MGNFGAQSLGMGTAAITLDQSINGMIKVIDSATRDTHGGKLWVWNGKQSVW